MAKLSSVVKLFGKVFHSFGASYKKQLSHYLFDLTKHALLDTDACVIINLLT